MKDNLKSWLWRWKLKLTPLDNLPRVVKYNPYVDSSKYVKDLLWVYTPLFCRGIKPNVYTSALGKEVWIEKLKFSTDVWFSQDPTPRIDYKKMPNSDYHVKDYEFTITYFGRTLFKLKPSIECQKI